MSGRPLCYHPEPPKGYVLSILPPRGKQVGCVSVFLRFRKERDLVITRGRKKNVILPLLHTSRGRKRHMVLFKTTPFFFFFFLVMHETESFFPKHAILFKWKLVPKHVRFKINPWFSENTNNKIDI